MKKFMILIFSMLLVFYPAFTDGSPPLEDNDFNIEQSLFNSDMAVAIINTVGYDVGISVTTNIYQNSIKNDYLQPYDINPLQSFYWQSVDLTQNGLDIANDETETQKTEGRLTQNIGKAISLNLIWSNEIYHEPER